MTEKHSGRVAQGHKLAALMKKRKEEILRNKDQSTEQSTEQSTAQFTLQPTVQSTTRPSDTYIYGIGKLPVLAIGVGVFLRITLPRLQIKSNSMKNNINHQNEVICFKIYSKLVVLIGRKKMKTLL